MRPGRVEQVDVDAVDAAVKVAVRDLHFSAAPVDLGVAEGVILKLLAHMASYARIFTLRYLPTSKTERHYELVELPKNLLERAKDGEFSMMNDSRQVPRPGVCVVKDDQGHRVFELYFDGGSERKLQIRHLKKAACVLHAEWFFPH
jgi:Type II site-specific deoxyribonuclease